LSTQALSDTLPTGEIEFAGQPRHIELPVDALYVPFEHSVHTPPLFPVHPALQMQAASATLPTGEIEFAGQPRHIELPVDVLYVPGKQYVQVALDTAFI
jgi:hypothetical protein